MITGPLHGAPFCSSVVAGTGGYYLAIAYRVCVSNFVKLFKNHSYGVIIDL